jgi:tRNA dimethylallyltransferase
VTGEPLLALVGPTSSGKTDASLPLAEALGAEIVCVDSMVLYRGMDVGTAKPSPEDRARVPHHMVDLMDPSQPFSVAQFQASAREALAGIEGRGRAALLVGGSGLYFRAVVDGLQFPGTTPRTRGLLEAEAAVLGPLAMHRRLAAFDPGAAMKIEPGNVRRTVRALEVAAVTGRRFSAFAAAWGRFRGQAVRAAGVEMPRDVLNGRIERRVEAMIPGLLEETRALMNRGFQGFLTSSQAIGYAEAVAILEGRLSQQEAAAVTVRRTKSLARRQMAWFRRDPRIRWFPAGEDGADGVVPEVLGFLRGSPAVAVEA